KSGKTSFDTYSDLWKTISSGKDWHGELYNKKKSGEPYWALSYISPIYDDKGVITHYLGISEDVTERREIEKQLVLAKESAEKSDLLKTEFLAQMSHEIRTPINAILSFTSLIKEELADKIHDDLKSSFSILDRAGNRIIRTIDLILHMSELQTGSYEFTPRIFDIYSDVLLKLFVNFKKAACDKSLEFALEKDVENALIYADEHKVYEIFNNIIDNALKYTIRGKVTVHLGKNLNGKLYVQVKDTGIGMSEEFRSNLFRLFVQEEQGYTRRYEGNGLGLALVKKYCDLNQADIQVQSRKGEGSVFTVTFNG
ncbi:MAG TPA: PAS domain-containing sensor histidine kinase, partial [Ignavibacteriales bacterium]|nr:PAS domain-containing sensor histidine kinase [Ignavibacteriales bacterium]